MDYRVATRLAMTDIGYRHCEYSEAIHEPIDSASRPWDRTIKTIASCARIARAGAIIFVDSGDYVADVAVWQHDDITIRAVGGRVRLVAKGASAEGKGIWVVRAKRMRVEGFDFEGAAVPGRNGAGIRLETGSLRVDNCRFRYNEMGLADQQRPQHHSGGV
jgi:hypothetical protein